ncbi:ANTAR domain-containing protein [Nocardia testacea]|uniref:ANTAR domain-containing protein n=1 Tax=Nocardia testacea TaxID=248551 RepID=UPI0033C74EEB
MLTTSPAAEPHAHYHRRPLSGDLDEFCARHWNRTRTEFAPRPLAPSSGLPGTIPRPPLTAEQAFEVLVWRSQHTNTKLRDLAEDLVAAITALGGADVSTRTRFDHLLLTTHQGSAIPPPVAAGYSTTEPPTAGPEKS